MRVQWLYIWLLMVLTSVPALALDKPLESREFITDSFPDASLYASKVVQTIRFERSPDTKKVVAICTWEEELYALKDKAEIFKSIHFDDQSEVFDVTMKYASGNQTVYFNSATTNYQSNGIFHSDVMQYNLAKSFYNTGTGYKLEYSKKYHDVRYLTNAMFLDYYPVMDKQIRVEIPDWLEVDIQLFNQDAFDIEQTTFEPGTTSKTVRQAKGKTGGPLKKQKSDGGIQFRMTNVPAYTGEESAPQYRQWAPHLLIMVKNDKENKANDNLFSNVDDLYGWYASLAKNMKNNADTLTTIVDKLTKGLTKDEDKVKALFYWVQDHIRYVAFEEGIMGFQPENCQAVFGKKYGDCKGMANLTKQMLIKAGYDARLTWIGTNGIPYDYTYPSMAVDNHMICTLFLDGEKYYLDATEEHVNLGEYADRIQGRPVMIEDGENYILDKVPVQSTRKNLHKEKIILSLDNTLLKGMYSVELSGEEKTEALYAMRQIEGNELEDLMGQFLASGNLNFEAYDVVSSSLSVRDSKFQIGAEFEFDNAAFEFGNDLYLNLDHKQELSGRTIDSLRMTDYDHGRKYKVESEYVLSVPSTHRIKQLPEPVNISNEFFDFELQYKQEDGKLIYAKNLELKQSILPKTMHKTWNNAIEELTDFYGEQVILSKR